MALGALPHSRSQTWNECGPRFPVLAQTGTLTVRLHHLANHSSDAALRHLCTEITAADTLFPETNLRSTYKLESEPNSYKANDIGNPLALYCRLSQSC